MLSTSIGNAIKKRRNELAITQPHLAELAGISTNTLYKLETGKTNATINVIEKIIEILGMKIEITVKQIL
jgi:DNA-binding XRE family transcriptional regulator